MPISHLSRLGLAPRLALAAAYAAVVWTTAWLVERGSPAVPDQPADVVAPASAVVLVRIDATYDVSEWTVRSDGRDLRAARADAHTWEGQAAGNELFVQALNAAPLASGGAIRLRIGSATPILVWGEGSASATVPLASSAAVPLPRATR